MTGAQRHPESFRDPAGFLFWRDGVLYRQVNAAFEEEYCAALSSGLFDELFRRQLLLPHEEVSLERAATSEAARVLVPKVLPFVSYPDEWSFSQLRDAALLTLELAVVALRHDMVLRDADARNVQFIGAVPQFIDTLSFERYVEGRPWAAYRQFCQQFLAPLALMASVDVRLGALRRSFHDGLPLDLSARLLGWRTMLRPGLLLHLAIHAKAEGWTEVTPPSGEALSRRAFERLLQHLRALVEDLELPRRRRTGSWHDYADRMPYTAGASSMKAQLVADALGGLRPRRVLDVGANTGRYSAIASAYADVTIAIDDDPLCVDQHYRALRADGSRSVHALVIDVANPTAASGWAYAERASLQQRGPFDAVLLLAIVHHLRLRRGIPFERIASFVGTLAPAAVVEYVPDHDPQVVQMARGRLGFLGYTRESFEAGFGAHFRTERCVEIGDSGRVLYVMRR